MGQGPIPTQVQGLGGNKSKLNQNAAAAIKNSPGTLFRIVVITAPTSGNLTVNDCAATGDAAAGNVLLDVAFGALTKGQVITLDAPCAVGITLSSVGGGPGVYAFYYS